jgi:hypothetical protein
MLRKSNTNKDIERLCNCRNFIEFLCTDNDFMAIELFLPQLAFEDMLYVFTILLMQPNICRFHLLPSSNVGCMVAKNLQDVKRIKIEMTKSTAGLYSLLIYSKDSDPLLNLIEKLAYNLQNRIQHLTESNPDLLKKTYNDLFIASKIPNQEMNYYNWQLDACLYFLVYEPNPTIMTYQTIMEIYCHKALRAKNKIHAESSALYKIAKNIAELCCFPELKNTRIYQFINKNVSDSDITNDNASVTSFSIAEGNTSRVLNK